MDHYDHSKIKNSEILAFSNFIFTEFNLHANKPLLHFLLYFFHFNAKSTSYKSKNNSYTFANSQRQSLLSSFNQIFFPSNMAPLKHEKPLNMAPLIMAQLRQLEDNFTP